jgi:hypothetical protein
VSAKYPLNESPQGGGGRIWYVPCNWADVVLNIPWFDIDLTLCSINNISTMNTAMKIIFAIATMLAHVTAPAESYRLLTASAANKIGRAHV